MFKNKFHKDVFKALVVICAILGLCRLTMGGVAVLIALLGAGFALTRKPGYLACCYIMFPFFTIFNRVVVGLSPVFLMTARLGNLFMIAAMILTGAGFAGRAREKLPIGWLFAYCVVACISSIDGWMPLISYLKIAQFILFLMGLIFVTRLLQQSAEGPYQLRCVFMALSIIVLWGSILSRFIPSVGYSMTISSLAAYGIEMTGAEVAASEGMRLFNGVTCHSQMLAPTVALMSAWLLCDMLLVERRFTILHVSILAAAPVLLYISRSRGGLLEIVAVMLTTIFVCVPRARLALAVKSRLMQLLILSAILLLAIAVIGQIRNQTISKWLRKTDDVRGDTRTLKEAFTGSRQGLVEYNLSDFKLNPLFGKGFQVMRGMEQAYRAKLITWYSASVEKGVTPYVILGETGLVGASVFLIFLCSFYGTCLKRRYLATLTIFTCVMVANLADSSLFSPGGGGGFGWIISCIGGFGIDIMALRQVQGAGAQRFARFDDLRVSSF
ncbi:MAG: O-antigen ligase family protein [Kiritimatiellae bacterium]|nr:O-antigen ligase family protein [Kiritimatiellia bacterium]